MNSIRLLLLPLLVSVASNFATASPENSIDELINRKLKEENVPPNAIVDDAAFLRRVSLDLVGRIPTLAEIEQFESQPAESRRNWIVDELLENNPEGYTSHFYHFWADLLRVNKRLGTNETPDDVEYAYRFWIKQALFQNLPYDEFVRQLITAEGHSWENGAVGYYQRDRGMPLDNLSNTIRVFLGTRLECAQCHDHPFDVWTQMDYYRMAAFSYGMVSQGHSNPNREALQKHLEKAGDTAFRNASGLRAELIPVFTKSAELKSWMTKQKSRGALAQILKSSGLSEAEFAEAAGRGIDALKTHGRTTQQLRNAENSLFVRVRYVTTRGVERTLQLPHDYQYKDAAPFASVDAHTMFGPEVTLPDSTGPTERIEAYAGWMTSPDNPTFTRVIVNRLWKQIFGAALFEPVDEITESITISNPELLGYLEGLMKDLDYDMRAFLAVLCKTRAYQHTVSPPPVPGEPYYFPGPTLRRLSAEQVWDSVMAQLLPEPDRYAPNAVRELKAIHRRERIYEALTGMPPDEYVKAIQSMAADGEMSAPEIVQLQKNEAPEQPVADLLRRFGMIEAPAKEDNLRPVITGLVRSPFPKNPAELTPDQARQWRSETQAEYREFLAMRRDWGRASELSSPAPRGHFLRDFGQSDRDMIDNASRGASVPQALNLLNGPLSDAIASRFSATGTTLNAAESDREKATLLFRALATRLPNDQELNLMLAEFDRAPDKGEALSNLSWALLNTNRFLFTQ